MGAGCFLTVRHPYLPSIPTSPGNRCAPSARAVHCYPALRGEGVKRNQINFKNNQLGPLRVKILPSLISYLFGIFVQRRLWAPGTRSG